MVGRHIEIINVERLRGDRVSTHEAEETRQNLHDKRCDWAARAHRAIRELWESGGYNVMTFYASPA